MSISFWIILTPRHSWPIAAWGPDCCLHKVLDANILVASKPPHIFLFPITVLSPCLDPPAVELLLHLPMAFPLFSLSLLSLTPSQGSTVPAIASFYRCYVTVPGCCRYLIFRRLRPQDTHTDTHTLTNFNSKQTHRLERVHAYTHGPCTVPRPYTLTQWAHACTAERSVPSLLCNHLPNHCRYDNAAETPEGPNRTSPGSIDEAQHCVNDGRQT